MRHGFILLENDCEFRPTTVMKETDHPQQTRAIGIRGAIVVALVVMVTLFPEPQPYVDTLSEGHALRTAGRYRMARATYQHAHMMQPRSIIPLLGEARTDLDLGKPGDALPVYREIADLGGTTVDVLVAWGQAYDALGDTERAVQLWQQALLHGGTAAHYWLGRGYLYLGDWDSAVNHLRASLEANTADDEDIQQISYWLAIGLTFADPAQAMEPLKQVASGADSRIAEDAGALAQTLRQAQADNREYGTVLGAGLFNLGEWRLAELHLQRVRAHRPDDVDALAYLGAIASERGDRVDADSLFRQALALDGNHALTLFFSGRQQLRLGNAAEARRTFGRLLALDPQNAAVCVEIARTYVAERKYTLAEEWFEAAVANAPLVADFYYVLADFEANTLFNLDKGLDAIREAITLEPANPTAYDLLGWLSFLSRDWTRAESALQHALELAPQQASTYYHLGRLYDSQGKPDAARWAFGRAVDLGAGQPAQRAAENALRRLGAGPEAEPVL